jgi:hypothetical protein
MTKSEFNNGLNIIIIQDRKYKVEFKATQTPDKSEVRIRCHGGVGILC